jgi:putative ABC transport system permease protein
VGLRRFLRRGRIDRERALEMRVHLEHATDDLIAAGWTPEAARREARRRFGNAAIIREEIYDMNSLPVVETLLRDARYAVRMLRKTPGFTLAAALTLALGIGANTAVFSVVNALLLAPLPYPDPARLGLLQYDVRGPRGENRDIGADGQMWLTVRDHATTVDAAAVGQTAGVNLVANEQAAYVQQQRVASGYFRVMGIPPALGREFSPDEDRPGGPPVVVLSHGLWQRVFRGNPAAIGQSIMLRGEPYTVIGVMPERFPTSQRYSFEGGHGIDLWTPLRATTTGEGGGINFSVATRLRDGVTWAQAQNDLSRLSAQAFSRWRLSPATTAQLGVVPMQEGMTKELRRPLLMLWGAVAIVLLIACVNIAGLLLARGSSRTREIATRMALGSGRGAVIRQLLVESAVLALAGGALGLAVGWMALTGLVRLGADVFDLWQPIALDARVLIVTLAIALATSLFFGLVPALQASRLDVQAGLAKSGTRGVAGAATRWPRRLLVIGEVALGVILLVSAGLLLRSFVHLRDLDPGFDEANVITVTVSLQDARYRRPEQVAHLFDETLRRLRTVPGVVNAAAGLGMPYTRLLNNGFLRTDGPHVDAADESQITNMSYVTPGFFETLKVPVRLGRTIADGDTASATPIAIVNDAFVARYYKNDQAIGRHIASGGTTREIVGVVGSTQQGSAGWGNFGPISPLPCVYVPLAQTNERFLTLVHTWFQPSWVVRGAVPAGTLVPELRRIVESVDAQLPIANVRTIADLRGTRLESQRFMMALVAGLGAIALVLAAIGVHGLIASSITERARELGIRLALGATAKQAMKAVVVPGIALAGAGVIIGGAAAIAVARLLHSYLWGVTPTDPGTFAGVIVLLLAVAAAASLIPALRVLRLDPARTLRAE